MSGDLVAGRVDLTHKIWMLFGHSAENKAGGRHVVGGHEIEEPPHTGFNAAVETVPLVHRNLDALVPVLDVDGEDVEHSR